jgi:hypothetical protein
VVSQTLCRIEVLPAFALPIMRTRNLIPSGTLGRNCSASIPMCRKLREGPNTRMFYLPLCVDKQGTTDEHIGPLRACSESWLLLHFSFTRRTGPARKNKICFRRIHDRQRMDHQAGKHWQPSVAISLVSFSVLPSLVTGQTRDSCQWMTTCVYLYALVWEGGGEARGRPSRASPWRAAED